MDIKGARRLLRDMSNYGWQMFQRALPATNTVNSIDIMMIAYMSQAQVNFEGIISLTAPHRPQSSAAMLQLRTLQEYFINARLITLQGNDNFANYLYINSEYGRIKTAKLLLNAGEISQQEYSQTETEANNIINRLKPNTSLPPIPQLIIAGHDYYDNKQFNIKQKCQIIDALDTNTTSAHSMVDNYNAVYKHLSGYVHPDPRTILHNIGYASYTSTININGDSQLHELAIAMSGMYYAGILELFVNAMNIYEPRRFKFFNARFHKYIPSTSIT